MVKKHGCTIDGLPAEWTAAAAAASTVSRQLRSQRWADSALCPPAPPAPPAAQLPAAAAACAPPGTPLPAPLRPAAAPPPLYRTQLYFLCTHFAVHCTTQSCILQKVLEHLLCRLPDDVMNRCSRYAPLRSNLQLIDPCQSVPCKDYILCSCLCGQLQLTAASIPCGPQNCAACAASLLLLSQSCPPGASAGGPAVQCHLYCKQFCLE